MIEGLAMHFGTADYIVIEQTVKNLERLRDSASVPPKGVNVDFCEKGMTSKTFKKRSVPK
jgi:hypothetical protein